MKRFVPLLTASIVLIVIMSTYSTALTSDGETWVKNIDTANFSKMFLPNHLISEFFIYLIKHSLFFFGCSIATLSLIQSLNAIISAACVMIFFGVCRILEFDWVDSVLASSIWGFSFSLWYFANGEIHHFGLFFILLILVLLMKSDPKLSMKQILSISVFQALANLFHQEHVLFLGVILVLAGLFRKNWFSALQIALFSSLATGVAYFTVGRIVYQVSSIQEFVSWLFQFTYSGREHPMLQIDALQLPKLLKGSLMGIHYGAQIIVDALRDPNLIGQSKALLLSSASAIGLLLITWGIACAIFAGPHPRRDVFWALIAWMLLYKSLNFKLSPESPEYHLVSTPPMILLFGMGIQRFSKIFRFLTMVIVLSSVFTVNLTAAILPWKRYGDMLSGVRNFVNQSTRESDLFISSESGIDSVLSENRKVLMLKDLFLQKKAYDGFPFIESQISENIKTGNAVYCYNFVPSAYAMKGIQLGMGDDAAKLGDFIRFYDHLQSRYHFVPAFKYWEKTTSQIYLFDPDRDYLWQITKK